MRRKTWKQNEIIVALVVVLSLSLAGCAFPFSKKEENISDVETSIEAENENADYHSIIYNNKKYVYLTDSDENSDEVLLLQMKEDGFVGVSKEEALEVGIKLKDKYYKED